MALIDAVYRGAAAMELATGFAAATGAASSALPGPSCPAFICCSLSSSPWAMPLNPILQLSGSVLDVVLLDAAIPDELFWSEEVEQQGLLSSSAWTDSCVLLLS
ncbi:uncharacterized protein LOC119348602 [Triticum dicoccoides]|uniref:uncharacterized protein LOC119348602 n=1 Tax=Triticum dicoccoides TaxID=85692 RepID=UPI00188E8A17|nr:uncharacterized protein LOC119348602 [Triticum dicoccoides]